MQLKIEAVASEKNRADWIQSIDGLRAVAIVAVLAHHSNTATFTNWALGNVGVAVFFSISGFLAYYVLFKDERRLGAINYNYFLLRRVMRIWPAYFVTILVAYIMASAAQRSAANEISLFTFTSNWHLAAMKTPMLGTLGPLWSIAVEEQFYVLAPLVYLGLRSRYWLLLSIGVFALSNVGRAYYMLYCGPPTVAGLYYVSYSYADIFIGGALAAKCYTENLIIITRRAQWTIFLVSAATIGVALRLWGPIVFPPYDPWTLLPYFLLSIAGPALLISVAAPHATEFKRFLSSAVMRALGTISFSLYLVHVLIIMVLRDWVGLTVGGIWYNLSFAVICPPIALFLYYGIEKPVLTMKAQLKSATIIWPSILIWTLLLVGTIRYFIVS